MARLEILPPSARSVSQVEFVHHAENLLKLFICEGLTSEDSPHTCTQTDAGWGYI